MIKCVKKLIEELDKNNVNYCHWKSSQHLDLTINGKTDLDVLVDPKDFSRLKILLLSIGFIYFEVDKHRRYPYIYDYLSYDMDSNQVIHLHLHTRLNIGPKHHKYIIFPFEGTILDKKELDNKFGLLRINYEHELLLLVIRQSVKVRNRDFWINLIKSKTTHPSYKRELDWLIERVDIENLKKATVSLLGFDLLESVQVDSLHDFFNPTIIKRIRKTLLRHGYLIPIESPIYALIKRWKREVYRIYYEVQKLLHFTPTRNRRRSMNDGLIFAFVGGDGSGKSSASSEVYKILRKQMNTAFVYLGTGDGNNSWLLSILKPIHKLLHRTGILSVKGKMDTLNDRNKKSKENKFRELLKSPWSLIILFDRYSKLKKMKKLLSKGYVIITDRYPQTTIRNVFDGPRLSGFFGKLEKNILTKYEYLKPEIIFRFECSPEVCVQRKFGEVTLEQAEFNIEKIKTIQNYNYFNAIKIDADLEFDVVVRTCMNHLFSRL